MKVLVRLFINLARIYLDYICFCSFFFFGFVTLDKKKEKIELLVFFFINFVVLFFNRDIIIILSQNIIKYIRLRLDWREREREKKI